MRAVCWSELFAMSRFPLLQFLRHVWLSLNAGFTVSCALRIHRSQLRRALSQCGAPRSPYSRISDVTDRLFFSMWLGCCSNSLCPVLQLIRRFKKQKQNKKTINTQLRVTRSSTLTGSGKANEKTFIKTELLHQARMLRARQRLKKNLRHYF